METVEAWLGAVAFVVMFGAISLQVFYRYVLGDPLIWSFELSIFCYIYVIYLGSVMALRGNTHIRFSMLEAALPPRARLLTSAIMRAVVAAAFMALIPSSIGYIRLVGGVRSSSLDMPWGVVLVIFPLAMAGMAVLSGLKAIEDIRQIRAMRGRV